MSSFVLRRTPGTLLAKLISRWGIHWYLGLFLPIVRMWPLPLLISKTFGPFLQPFEVLLNNRTSIWCINHSFKFCNICKITEGVLYPIIWIINCNAEQYWHLYNYPRENLCDVVELTFIAYEESCIQIITLETAFLPS